MTILPAGGTKYVTLEQFGHKYAILTKSWAGVGLAVSMGTTTGDTSSDRNFGKIYVDGEEYIGGNTYPTGSVVTLHAVPNEDFLFIGWFGSGRIISLNDTYRYTIEDVNVSLTAEFLYLGDGEYDTGWSVDSILVDTASITYYIVSCDKAQFTDHVIMIAKGTNALAPSVYLAESNTIKGSVTAVKVTDGITSVGDNAFSAWTTLKDVWLPDSVTSIGADAFSGATNMQSIFIPDSVLSIGARAFSGCSRLTNVTLGNGITTIKQYAFSGTILSSITLPASLTTLEQHVFYGCSRLSNIYVKDGNAVFVSRSGALYTYNKTTKEAQFVLLGAGRSDEFIVLTELDINAESYIVTSIGDRAFAGCTSLMGITLPDSVVTIGVDAFSGCLLQSATMPALAISHISRDALITVVITGDTSIEDNAFNNCNSLLSVTIGNSVTSIGDSAFSGCDNLTSITFEGTVAEWNEISKGALWNQNTGDYTVTCTDGVVNKE